MALSVVSSVTQFLGGMLVQETELLGGVADQITNIQVELRRMQCFLEHADARKDESTLVLNWVSEIRELAYDVEDTIETYILKSKYTNFYDPKKYIRLHKIGKQINTLQSKIQDITRSVDTYGFVRTGQGQGMSSTSEMQRQLRESYPHYDDEDVIGLEDDIKVLAAELINKKGPHLVCIVGMGGLGKTTLAKKVYNHDDVKRHFDCCAWTSISQQFQGSTILQEIIRKVSNQTGLETLNDGELKEKLYKLLEDKCYLVVLDDIWSTGAWDILKPAFPKGKMGSKIMLTTRIKGVSFYADPSVFFYEPTCLTQEQSWQLLRKKAFLSRNITPSSSSSHLPDIEKKEKFGRSILKKCGGLPLAVVVLGGFLAMKESVHEWEMVAKDVERYLNKAQPQQEQLDVSWILSLSYYNLPYYLKPCFLYLGHYLEDTEFHKRELIQKWIGEGFVQQHNEKGTTKDEIGEEYLIELINRSMIQVGTKSFRGKIKTCRMHDLMRDMCLSKAKEENFLRTFYGGSSAEDFSSSSSTSVMTSNSDRQIRRLAIHFTSDATYVSMQQSTRRSTHLRTLLWEQKLSNPVDSIGMLKSVCNKFKFLRVLEFHDVEIDGLPRAIGKLIHLKYLTVSLIREIKVPTTIGNLRNIQFLTLSRVKRLPNVIWKMTQLTYFSTRGWSCLTHDEKPLRVDGLKNLSTLELRWKKELQIESNLRKLPNLQKLYLHGIDGSSYLQKNWFDGLDHLQCLSLHFQIIPSDYDWSALSRCHCLWKLCLSGGMKKLPKPDDFPPNLTKLSLELDTLEEDPIPTLETIPNLESLLLKAYNRVTTKYCFSAERFGRLQYLRLGFLYNLEELEVEKGALPCLIHLQINDCFRLRKLPEGLRFLTVLKKLEVVDMPPKFNRRLQEDGDDWHKIQHIPTITIL